MKNKCILRLLLIGIFLGLANCTKYQESPSKLTEGDWKGYLELREGVELPFHFTLQKDSSTYKIVIQNAEERILVDEIEQKGDSLFIKMPVFDSEFHLVINSPTELTGNWYDYTRGIDYHIPFRAIQEAEVLLEASKASTELSPLYSLTFDLNGEDPKPAIGKFVQQGQKISGTILTETGDYRYLDGVLNGNSLKLSAFDGSHAFLFVAQIEGDSISGKFWSGNHWLEPWEGKSDPDATLAKPDALTYLLDISLAF